ncbi:MULTISPECIES: hypothetical protein [unclassified Corallococcus]|nr:MULTISPECIES: hypothetical protein [unclassified Corallococcus]
MSDVVRMVSGMEAMMQTMLVFVPVALLVGAVVMIPRSRRRVRRWKVRAG